MMERGDQSKEGRGRHLPPDWSSQAQRWSMMEGLGSGAKKGGGSSLSGDAWLSVSQVKMTTVVCGCVKVQSQVTNRERLSVFVKEVV